MSFDASRLYEVEIWHRKPGGGIMDASIIPNGTGGFGIAGYAKLVQRFLMELLTELGSVSFDSNKGTNFLTDARLGKWRTSRDVAQSFAAAELTARQNLKADETPTTPADEVYSSASLLSASVNGDQVVIHVQITNGAGQSGVQLVPISLIPPSRV